MRLTAWVSAACAVVLAAAAPAEATQQYKIAEHDTLYSIARRFGVSMDRLAEVNGIRDPGRIHAGAILVIPDPVPPQGASPTARPSAPPSTGRPSSTPPSAYSTYVVRPGDTLYSLARRYGLTVEAIQRANGLPSPHQIRAGQVLQIPGPPRESEETVAVQPLPVRLYMPPAPEGEHRGPAPVPPSRARDVLIQRITTLAQGYVGTPYAWGGTSRSGLDCSGLVYILYSPYVPDLPRGSYGQFTVGQRVAQNELQAGDLVFFTTYASGPSHVGIYIGDGRFVTANVGVGRVVVDRLDVPYWAARYIGARRLF